MTKQKRTNYYKFGRRFPESRRLREQGFSIFFGFHRPEDFFTTANGLRHFYAYTNTAGHVFVMFAEVEEVGQVLENLRPWVLFETMDAYGEWKWRQIQTNRIVSTLPDIDDEEVPEERIIKGPEALDGVVLE